MSLRLECLFGPLVCFHEYVCGVFCMRHYIELCGAGWCFPLENSLRKSFSPFSTSVHSIWFVYFDLSCSAATRQPQRLHFYMCVCVCMYLLVVHIIQLVHSPYCNFYEKSELFFSIFDDFSVWLCVSVESAP